MAKEKKGDVEEVKGAEVGSKEETSSALPDKISPEKKFVVKGDDKGSFRLYNEFGQAVSPVSSSEKDIREMNKSASRANALRKFE